MEDIIKAAEAEEEEINGNGNGVTVTLEEQAVEGMEADLKDGELEDGELEEENVNEGILFNGTGEEGPIQVTAPT